MIASALGLIAGLLVQDAPLQIVGQVELFAPGVASTQHSEVRLTLSPDGQTALWFSRNRPGGAGAYDIWMSRRTDYSWSPAEPVSFNSPGRDFDPAFSADGRHVYFCSDRPGGQGEDDVWRVAVLPRGFGEPENLGSTVNSPGDEFAPMLSPDGTTLLFSSDRPGGAGRHDLYVAPGEGETFGAAEPMPGAVNTAADEFDATFLGDGATIVFSRAADMSVDRIDLFATRPTDGVYDAGIRLSLAVNDPQTDTYGPMLDWSRPDSLTFSGRRDDASSMELYRVSYRLVP